MAYSYITNIRHFMPEDPSVELPEEACKFREFLGFIIKAATSTTDIEFVSGLPCRKRVSRKPCPGFLSIKREQIPHQFVFWHCTDCEDGGRISDWKSSWYDLSEWKPTIRPEPGEKPLSIILTREEYRTLLSPEINSYDPDSERIMFGARRTSNGIVLQGFEADMDNFLGFVASDANHEDNSKRRKLIYSVCDKLHDILESSAFDSQLH